MDLTRQRAGLAERWHRAITRTGAVPYSAAEVRARLAELVETAERVLAAKAELDSAVSIGRSLGLIGYRTPEALGATIELLSTALLEDLAPAQAAAVQPRVALLLGGIAAGFSTAARHLLLDEQEASRAAVLAENRRAWDALRRQAALLDLAPDAILVRTIGTGHIAFWNRGAEALYGWRADEALGRVSHALLEPESPRPIAELEAELFREGRWEGELVHTRRDGSRVVVSSRWAPQWDDAGRPLACLEINTDITLRKQMEAALREREASLERAQSLAALGSWESDLISDVHYWSPEAYRLLGYADREVPPTREMLFDAIHPDDVEHVRNAIAEAMTTGSSTFEMRTAARDGAERILLSRNEVRKDAEGRPCKLVGTALDITERKRAEAERLQLSAMQAARAESEATQRRLAFLADASRVLALSLDYETTLHNVVSAAIPALADACRLDLFDELGRVQPTVEVHAPDEAASRVELDPSMLRKAMESGRAQLTPNAILVPSSAGDKPWGVLSYLAAPSRPAYTEVELELAVELARRCYLAIDNARLHAEAQRATRLRDEFLSVAAHELKTPMTTLRGYAQWLLRPVREDRLPDPTVLERGLRAIDSQSAKLVDLTRQLLDVSRIEAGKLMLERCETDLVALVRGVLDAAQATTPSHAIVLEAPRETRVLVDPLRLEQVISNLIDNAIKYSPDGGVIEVVICDDERGDARVAVRDHGLGIPLERRENLFDRFYQAHGEGHFGGLGLGLYISRQIVELHGGAIAAEFPPDGGCLFMITLPPGL